VGCAGRAVFSVVVGDEAQKATPEGGFVAANSAGIKPLGLPTTGTQGEVQALSN
jgi:hypothetical protein